MGHVSHFLEEIESVKIEKKFTNKDLSKLSGLSESKISRLLKHKNDIKLSELFLLWDALGIKKSLQGNSKITDKFESLTETQIALVNALISELVGPQH